jgi:hypothetical protein
MTQFLQSRGFEIAGSVFAGVVLAVALWGLMT